MLFFEVEKNPYSYHSPSTTNENSKGIKIDGRCIYASDISTVTVELTIVYGKSIKSMLHKDHTLA